MKSSLLPSISLFLLAATSNLSAQPGGTFAEPWYFKSITSSAYAAATAHEPNYANKELWPEEMQKAAFMKQPWPKARVLVFTNPGGKEVKDGWEVKYWLENGKPATTPFDENTDLVFPDGSAGVVSLTPGRKYQPAAFRHLTIGQGCTVLGHFSVGGNTWIKKGGGVICLDSTVGKENTFLRNDNDKFCSLVDHFFIKKIPPASCELIGKFESVDNWRVESGLMIIGPDSQINMGNRTDPEILEEGAVVMMSGSTCARRTNCDWGDDLVVKGKLAAGLPDRPLTRNARLGLSSKSKGIFINSTKSEGRKSGPDDYGLVVPASGSLKVITADPAKARLMICCPKRENDWGQIQIQASGLGLNENEVIAKLKTMTPLIDMVLIGDADMSNVIFEDVRKGGIHLADPAKSNLWKNVTLGASNGGSTLSQLVSPLEKN